MASQTIITRAQGVIGAMRSGHISKAAPSQIAIPGLRQDKIVVQCPQRKVQLRSRKASSVVAAAGNGSAPASGGLSIDLRGEG